MASQNLLREIIIFIIVKIFSQPIHKRQILPRSLVTKLQMTVLQGCVHAFYTVAALRLQIIYSGHDYKSLHELMRACICQNRVLNKGNWMTRFSHQFIWRTSAGKFNFSLLLILTIFCKTALSLNCLNVETCNSVSGETLSRRIRTDKILCINILGKL